MASSRRGSADKTVRAPNDGENGMTFLPIVERELRAASRRRSTYWSRAASALVAILICAWMFLVSARSEPVKELGKILFYILSAVFFGNSLLAGIRFTADTLSEEKREGTLGLLFLTDLKGYDVVLGKLVASSMTAFYGLLAIFPVMAIPLLLGGVAPAEFWRMTLVLSNSLLFSLAAGLFVSSLSRSARKAMGGTLLLIIGVNGLIPALGAYVAYSFKANQVDEAFLVPSAAYAYGLVFDAAYRTNADRFLWSVLFTFATSMAFLALASIAARYSWQDRPAGAGTRRLVDWWRRQLNGTDAERRRFRTRLLEISPCYWLGGRQRLKPAAVWCGLGIVAVGWLWGYLKWRQDWLTEATYVATALLVHTAVKFWVASEACQKLGQDHRSGALELILSTPLTVSEIVRGQMLALRRQFLGPVSLIVVVDLAFMVAGLRSYGLASDASWSWTCMAGIVVFVADVYTLCWVGMWVGLIARRPNRASGNTVIRVMLVPWLAFVGFLILASFISLWTHIESDSGFLLGLWFLLSMLNNLALFWWAQRHLHRDLRRVATQRFDQGRSRLWPFSRTSEEAPDPPRPSAATQA